MTKKDQNTSIDRLREDLETAKSALEDARSNVQKAQREFDASGERNAYSALSDAERGEREALAYMARAQRLLDTALAEHAHAERARLEARRAELVAEVESTAASAAAEPLIKAELEALLGACEVHECRLDLARAFRAKYDELDSIERALGIEKTTIGVERQPDGRTRTRSPRRDPATIIEADHALERAIDAEIRKLGDDRSTRARRLRSLRDGISGAA